MKVPASENDRQFVETALNDGLSIAEIASDDIDEAYVRARGKERRILIFEAFEAASSTLKGTTTMPRTMQQLNATEVAEITRTFRGQLPGVPNPSTAAVARRFNITESDAQAFRVAATTPAPTRSITESGGAGSKTIGEAARERLIHEAAQETLDRANAAEERGLEHASLQELAAVAALSVPR